VPVTPLPPPSVTTQLCHWETVGMLGKVFFFVELLFRKTVFVTTKKCSALSRELFASIGPQCVTNRGEEMTPEICRGIALKNDDILRGYLKLFFLGKTFADFLVVAAFSTIFRLSQGSLFPCVYTNDTVPMTKIFALPYKIVHCTVYTVRLCRRQVHLITNSTKQHWKLPNTSRLLLSLWNGLTQNIVFISPVYNTRTSDSSK
jgi:hypothetical protein